MVNSNEELKPKVVGGGDVKREEVEDLESLEEDLVNMVN